MIVHNQNCEPWDVTIVDTGLDTNTGGRINKIKSYVDKETFMLTYGDGVCDININSLLSYHKKRNKIATITCVLLQQNKGVIEMDEDNITDFREKSLLDSARINGGYMVLEPHIFDYIKGDEVFEGAPMERLAHDRQIIGYKYDGFWQCMDTKREMERLQYLIENNTAPWMKWD